MVGEMMTRASQVLRDRVLPKYSPIVHGDTLDNIRRRCRAVDNTLSNAEVDAAVRSAVIDGLLWWDGANYRRGCGRGPADSVGPLLDALDVTADPSHWPTMPQSAWEKLAEIQDLAKKLREAVAS